MFCVFTAQSHWAHPLWNDANARDYPIKNNHFSRFQKHKTASAFHSLYKKHTIIHKRNISTLIFSTMLVCFVSFRAHSKNSEPIENSSIGKSHSFSKISFFLLLNAIIFHRLATNGKTNCVLFASSIVGLFSVSFSVFYASVFFQPLNGWIMIFELIAAELIENEEKRNAKPLLFHLSGRYLWYFKDFVSSNSHSFSIGLDSGGKKGRKKDRKKSVFIIFVVILIWMEHQDKRIEWNSLFFSFRYCEFFFLVRWEWFPQNALAISDYEQVQNGCALCNSKAN